MARSHARVQTSVWGPGSSFRDLSMAAQWAYIMLLAQPQINNLGMLPYTPEKWTRLAHGLQLEGLEAALLELQQGNFIMVNSPTAELLVRTFVKHDKVWSQWQLVKNARGLIEEVESWEIRDYLTSRHPWLVKPWNTEQIKAHETGQNTPLDSPLDTPLSQPAEGGPDVPENTLERPLSTPLYKSGAHSTGEGEGEDLKAVDLEALASTPAFDLSQHEPSAKDGHDAHASNGNTNSEGTARALQLLHLAIGPNEENLTKLKRASRGLTEGDLAYTLEAVRGPGVRDKTAVALSTLASRRDAMTRARSGESS